MPNGNVCDTLYHVPRISCVAARMQVVPVLTGLLLMVLAGCVTGDHQSTADEAPDGSLRAQLANTQGGFTFKYQTRGTQVLDCILPNRSFEGLVYPGGTFELSTETPAGMGQVIAVDGTVYLSANIFADGTVPTPWLGVSRLDMDAVAVPLRQTLGTGIASYVLSPGVPPDGNAIAWAALDQAPVSGRLEPFRTAAGQVAQGHRIVVEGEPPVPVIDAWLGSDGHIVRIQVQDSLPGQPGTPNPDTGWIIDYAPLPPSASPPVEPTGVTPWESIEPAQLVAPAREGCDIEIGPESTMPTPRP